MGKYVVKQKMINLKNMMKKQLKVKNNCVKFCNIYNIKIIIKVFHYSSSIIAGRSLEELLLILFLTKEFGPYLFFVFEA